MILYTFLPDMLLAIDLAGDDAFLATRCIHNIVTYCVGGTLIDRYVLASLSTSCKYYTKRDLYVSVKVVL